jgi:ATP-dependent DNA helicase RecG
VRVHLEPALQRLKLNRVIDVLNHFPRTYTTRCFIKDLKPGMHASIAGEVQSVETRATKRRRMKLTEVVISDGTGSIRAIYFNQPWLAGKLQRGLRVGVSGPVDFSYNQWTIKPGGVEFNPPKLEAGFEPDYPLTEGILNSELSELIRQALPTAALVPDPLPQELAAKLRLMPLAEAYAQAHQPTAPGMLKAARLALKYREFFLMQAGLRLSRRQDADDTALTITVDDDLRERAARYFPFELTEAQKRVCRELEQDLTTPGRMHRLLQGDVGSGKTAVALYAALLMIGNGYQAALMAPTEVLARQHFANISAYLRDTRVQVRMLLGGMKKAERDQLCRELEAGEVHILIGTHALIEDYVKFKGLGLCVIDEQHKFGVRQRAKLRDKGDRPHVLAMSATPIPRTLSMTLYGALDVSIIDELPPGRTPVITEWVHRNQEGAAHERIRTELQQGGRAYFIYPLINESDKLEARSAIEYAEELKTKVFPEFRVGMVHGQMNTDEKERAMQAFRDGELDVLAATVVVEVGVDVPEANVMVIENAERFGLSQLHQLRGRVGRGRRQSYLFLFGEPRTQEAVDRLTAICRIQDGFKIAEVDLKLRGFGDFAGTRQSGLPKLHIGDFEADFEALERARRDAARWGEKVNEELIRQCLALHYGKRKGLMGV